jgi:hypothetical protein
MTNEGGKAVVTKEQWINTSRCERFAWVQKATGYDDDVLSHGCAPYSSNSRNSTLRDIVNMLARIDDWGHLSLAMTNDEFDRLTRLKIE